jgi:hypothetical protein
MRLSIWTITNVTILVTVGVTDAAVPVNLIWNAPPDCPGRDAVLTDVQRILDGPTTRTVVAQADVTKLAPEHWSVHLVTSVDGAPGDRTLDANSCASLAAATALILAWTVDPTKGVPPAPPPEPSGGPLPAPTSVPVERPARSGSSHASGSLGAAVSVSGMADSNTLPAPAVAGEIAVAGLLGPFRLEISGADWVTQQAMGTVLGETTEGTTIHLFDAAARGCYGWRPGAGLELSPCLGAALFFATGDGLGGTPARFTSHHFSAQDWAAAQGDVLGTWRLFGPLALRASVGVLIPPAPPHFEIHVNNPEGNVFLHRPGVSARATLGVEARFP